MSIDPEIVDVVASALADDWNPERDPVLTAMFRDYAQTALEAAAPVIAAQAWDEGKAAGIRQADWEYGATVHEFVAHNPYRADALEAGQS